MRYSRQTLFDGIGLEGQRRLGEGRVLVIGCGALGSAQIEALARAGVGYLRIIDRDFVEESNLQRQTMFTELDAAERMPKAAACKRRIGEINSKTIVEAIVADAHRGNIEELIRDCSVVLDGTDNFSTRYLINDACVKHDLNWIYGAAVGSYGVTMTIRPQQTPCLRCVFDEMPPAGSAPTCDTSGVIMPIISVVAAVQIAETLKLLVNSLESLHNSLLQFDVWRNDWRRIKLNGPAENCPTCALRRFEMLEGDEADFTTVLCGRDAIQISPSKQAGIDLATLAEKLSALGEVSLNPYLLRFCTGEYEITVFKDARSIIRGTRDASVARSLYSKYVGN